jgi:CHASE2 domain-containing sensor protein
MGFGLTFPYFYNQSICRMTRRLPDPHSIIITVSILVFIWMLNLVRLNLHYLDPFNNGFKEYDVTDIVYANLSEKRTVHIEDIVIVNSGRPDRTRIAQLVNKLNAAGARVIGLDLYFQKNEGTVADSLLRDALCANDNIVLACTIEDENKEDDRLEGIGGVDTFFSNHATLGYGNFPSNATKSIRLVSPRETIGGREVPAFSTAILGKYDKAKQQKYLARDRPVEHIYFTGHRQDFIFNQLDRMLDTMTIAEVRATCQDRIVLVGYAPDDPWANSLLDRHYTPINPRYDTKSIPDMYGIVIHANVLQMVLSEQYIRSVPRWLAFLLSVLICYANVRFFRWVYRRFNQSFHGITRGIQLLEFIAFFFLVTLVFYYFRLKIDLAMGILAVLLAYDFIMIYQSLVLPRVPLLRRLSGAATDLGGSELNLETSPPLPEPDEAERVVEPLVAPFPVVVEALLEEE